MRGLKNYGLVISGITATVSLLVASILIIYTSAYGTPGTWTPIINDKSRKEATYGWPQPTASVVSIARGRYGSTGYYFDTTFHSASRACGGVVTTTWMIVAMYRQIDPEHVVVTFAKINESNTWGYSNSYSGTFFSSQTQTIAEFKSPAYTFQLDSGTAYAFP